MSTDRLIYMPLGGAGEIGMNAYVYGYGPEGKERFILVDLGVTFPDMEGAPGVDLIFPDVSWLAERKDRLDGIFITHAHEDHIGALAHLYDQLRAPVYTRAFTGLHAVRKMEERGHDPKNVNITAPWPETRKVGPFEVGFLPISHSIPESSALVIDTPKGRIIHTGDFKLDTTPVLGEAFDEPLWKEVAAQGVRALVCDSTNVFSLNPGRSEASVAPEIEKLIRSRESGMVVATTFASNVARVKSLAEAAQAAGRSVVLLGRAMRRMVEASIEAGVLTDFPSVVSPDDAQEMPRENLMLLVTGSQGERRAASAQLARGKYMGITLKEGDLFLFSSKTIPGNERSVSAIINQLSEKGVDVVDDDSGRYHVSGHANRPDLLRMQEIVNPEIVVPMHGEHRHLRELMKLSEANGRRGYLVPNGMMIDLSASTGDAVEYVETGRVYLDGAVQIGAFDGIIRDRLRMARNGVVTVSVFVDEDDQPPGEVWCELHGLPEIGRSNASLVEVLEEDLNQLLARSAKKTRSNDEALEEAMTRLARKTALDEIGKKPEIRVLISRVEG